MNTIRIIFFALVLFSVLPGFTEDLSCNVARSAIESASRIRQLKIKQSVPCVIEDRERVKQFLMNAIQNKIPAEKMRFDELIAKAVGFIPEDYDYKLGLVSLYLSQLGGYYDPEKKRYAMAGWLPEVMQPTVAVHELTHALQDQYFNLETFIDDTHFTTDKLLARAALVEGDATAVMLDYQRGLIGQAPLAQIEQVDAFVLQTVMGMALATSQGQVPESLKSALLFPYASGIRFAHFLLRTGGYEQVNRAFMSPPDTTEEVLHPEKFGKRKAGEYVIPEDADFATDLMGSSIKYSDTLGEFSIAALLSGGSQTQRDRAAAAAAGWAGDRIIVSGERGREKIFWRSCWDTPKDASEFFDAYREFLVARGTAVQQGENNSFVVQVDARKITQVLINGCVSIGIFPL